MAVPSYSCRYFRYSCDTACTRNDPHSSTLIHLPPHSLPHPHTHTPNRPPTPPHPPTHPPPNPAHPHPHPHTAYSLPISSHPASARPVVTRQASYKRNCSGCKIRNEGALATHPLLAVRPSSRFRLDQRTRRVRVGHTETHTEVVVSDAWMPHSWAQVALLGPYRCEDMAR